jgi:hypothetical protein
MKKLVIVALSAVLAIMAVEPAHAQDQKVLAIIDTAVDSNKITSVIHEVCFAISSPMGCPSGQTLSDSLGKYSFYEGKGAGGSPIWPATQINNLGKVYHGYNATQAALAINPEIKIVFIRMTGIAKTNGMQAADPKDPYSIVRALQWVSDNADKYSIDAVSISQAFITAQALGLCSNKIAVAPVASLGSNNIPVFAATGNDKLRDKVGFPACIPGVTGVGAFSTNLNILDPATNSGPGLDVIAQDTIKVVRHNGTIANFSASSAATQIAASVFLSKNTYTTFELFLNSFTKVLGYTYISK